MITLISITSIIISFFVLIIFLIYFILFSTAEYFDEEPKRNAGD
jgi:hypothetical protein